MKKMLLITSGFALSAYAAVAGTLTEPVIEEVAEMTEKGSSSGGILLPLLLLALVGAAIASKGDDDDEVINGY